MICMRSMVKEDLHCILDIEKKVFNEGWNENLFCEELENPLSYYVVATKQSKMVGYGGVMVVGIESDITKVAVSPEYQRQGIGTAIIQELLVVVRQCGSQDVFLEVRSDNDNAFKLYEKSGFNVCGKRFGYYKDADAILMKLELLNDK